MRRKPIRRASPVLEDLEDRKLLSFTASLDSVQNVLTIVTDRDNNEVRITEANGLVFVDDLKEGGDPLGYPRGEVDLIVFRAGPGNDKFYNDTFIPSNIDGGNGNNYLQGGNGPDVIAAGPGNDTFVGLGGIDQFNGGGGNDRFFQDGFGSPGGSDGGSDGGTDGGSDGGFDDGFTPFLDTAGNVLTLAGGSGNVEIRVTEAGGVVFVDDLKDNVGPLSFDSNEVDLIVFRGGPGNDRFLNDTAIPSNIDGGNGNDYLQGGNGRDVIAAGPGNDVLLGLGGNDLLDGGEGNDNLNGGVGNDILRGGSGNDFLDGGPGRDQLFGGEGQDNSRGPDADRDRDRGRGRNRGQGRNRR